MGDINLSLIKVYLICQVPEEKPCIMPVEAKQRAKARGIRNVSAR